MADYTVSGTRAAAATQSPLNITAASTTRFFIEDFRIAATNTSAPTDVGSQVDIQRSTTAGTGTSVTPNPTDPADGAARTTALSNISAEPTYTASSFLKRAVFNPRVTYRWTAWDPKARLVAPATASNGIGFQGTLVGGATGNFTVDCDFCE